jgi:hypothetical protein
MSPVPHGTQSTTQLCIIFPRRSIKFPMSPYCILPEGGFSSLILMFNSLSFASHSLIIKYFCVHALQPVIFPNELDAFLQMPCYENKHSHLYRLEMKMTNKQALKALGVSYPRPGLTVARFGVPYLLFQNTPGCSAIAWEAKLGSPLS